MKKFLLFLIGILSSIIVCSQTPNTFNYQSVIYNNDGELVVNQNVNFRFFIREGSAEGTTVYLETQLVKSNDQGVCNLRIGEGTDASGSLGDLNWGNSTYFLNVSVDINGTTSFIDVGTVELVSVPYAMFANDVANKDDADPDPQNEIQDLNLESNILTITNNASATEINLSQYVGSNTDEQVLNLDGTTLSISGGNDIDVSSLVNDADYDPMNEFQDLTLSDDTVYISNGNWIKLPEDIIDDADNNPLNELQNLTLSNDTIYISDGNYIKLPADIIDDADNDPTNEFQDLTLTGDTLKLSDGGQVVFPYDSSYWVKNASDVYYNTGNVGIGTSKPMSKLEVKADALVDTLFSVKDKDGNVVFAVFPDGAKVYVNESTKGNVGGFAVTGRNPTKGMTGDYFLITSDSARIYIDDTTTTKGNVGGFAVTGRNPTKGAGDDYLRVTRDSTRVYVNESGTKGNVGGFAVTGRNPNKSTDSKFMDITYDNYFIGHESGQKNTTGIYNAFLGYNAGYSNTKGSKNTFLGYKAGFNVTTGQDNVLLGYQAGYNVTTAGNNISIGSDAGYSNDVNSDNIFLGRQAGYNHKGTGIPNEANNNIYMGFQAGFGDAAGERGVSNIFIGNQSGFSNTSGLYNVFLGSNAGHGNTTGANNVILGNDAGVMQTSGLNNVFLGNNAGYSNGDGTANVFIGNNAGFSLNSQVYNVMIGAGAGSDAEGGNNNVFIGLEAGRFHVDGESNVILGNKAGLGDPGFHDIVALRNVVIGTEAGRNINDAIDNVFIGHKAGEGVLGNGGVTGDFNVIIGERAGLNIGTGSRNVFIGNEAGSSTTEGEGNIFVGFECGYSNVTGSFNSFFGYEAGKANTTGANNMFMGYKAGELNLNGSNNMFIGTMAGSKNTSGNSNLFIGDEAGSSNTTGAANMYIGSGAGKSSSTSVYNMAIGMGAGRQLTTGSHNLLIGQVAGDELTTGAYNIYIGELVGSGNSGNQTSQSNVYIGFNAAYYTKGSYNTYLGSGAGAGSNISLDTTGSYNTFIGTGAGYGVRGNNNTALGYHAGWGALGNNNVYIGNNVIGHGTESYKLYIDASNTTSPLIYGDFLSNILEINGTLTVDGILNVNNEYNLPATDGSANFVMKTDGSGNLSWINVNNLSNSATQDLDLNTYNIIDVGSIGIGTGATLPEELIELAGSSSGSPGIIFRRGTAIDQYTDWKIEDNGGYLRTYYRVNNDTWNHATTIDPNTSYFGIGTTSPGSQLTVVGDDNGTSYTADGIINANNSSTSGGVGIVGRVNTNNAAASGNRIGVAGVAWYGQSVNYGLYGYGFGGTIAYGIYAQASGATTNYAGYFSGNVHVAGTLSKSAGSFKIDHPLDPENKNLSHSFVESPDMMNIYNGNIVLDGNGEAIVTLPDYFEALNMEFRYQLTPIGAPGPNLYIAEEISNNKFKIAGGTLNMKVSWQVTGIRHDRYANENRIQVVTEKTITEKEEYLNPKVFNKPNE